MRYTITEEDYNFDFLDNLFYKLASIVENKLFSEYNKDISYEDHITITIPLVRDFKESQFSYNKNDIFSEQLCKELLELIKESPYEFNNYIEVSLYAIGDRYWDPCSWGGSWQFQKQYYAICLVFKKEEHKKNNLKSLLLCDFVDGII